jgi:hypothetical protein
MKDQEERISTHQTKGNVQIDIRAVYNVTNDVGLARKGSVARIHTSALPADNAKRSEQLSRPISVPRGQGQGPARRPIAPPPKKKPIGLSVHRNVATIS